MQLNTGSILYAHRLSTRVGCFLFSLFLISVDKKNIEFA